MWEFGLVLATGEDLWSWLGPISSKDGNERP